MKKQKAIRILKTDKLYTCSAPGVYHLGYNPMIGFTRMNKHFKEYYHYEIVIYKNRYIIQNESWDQAFKNCKQLYADPEHARKVMKKWQNQLQKFFDFIKKLPDPKNLSDKELNAKYKEFIDQFAEVWAASLVTDGIGVYTESELWEDFFKEVNTDDARQIFLELTHSPKPSFAGDAKVSLLNLTLMFRNNDKDFDEKLKEHQKKYFWIEGSYDEAKELTEEDFLQRIKNNKSTEEEIKKEIQKMDRNFIKAKQDKILNKVKISENIKDKLLLTQDLSTWQDERKGMSLYGNFYFCKYLEEIGKRMRFTLDEMFFVQPKEIGEFFESGKKPTKDQIKSRTKLCVHISTVPVTDEFFEGKDAEEILEAYESIEHEKELKGTVASFGKEHVIKGEVNIVMDPRKADFKKGQIMITTMTRPEFVPLMHLAKAIVTDEGGVTTHAGIVSRELGIACIVGTRSATKVLKSGDMIELDTKTGEVRKI